MAEYFFCWHCFLDILKNIFMKKFLFIVLFVSAVSFTGNAGAQGVGFYFYPDLNIYFNPQTREYAYQDHDAWVHNRRLPHGYAVRGHEHVTVYSNSPEVWRDNDAHREKYKNWHGDHHDRDDHRR